MSLNLKLSATYLRRHRSPETICCELLQTPTAVTEAVLDVQFNPDKARKIYLEWVAQQYAEHQDIVQQEVQRVDRFLRKHHRHAKWGL